MDSGKGHIELSYELLENATHLSEADRDLLAQAMNAAESAYAPHSKFLVGCALRLVDGRVLLGNNQENLAYPSGLCAERIALFHAGATGVADQIEAIAIRARSGKVKVDQPVTPCGACRQVMLEYENLANRPFRVLMQGEEGPILSLKGVKDSLMPFSFDIQF